MRKRRDRRTSCSRKEEEEVTLGVEKRR